MLLFTGSLVLCRNFEDTVSVDVECHFDLRNTALCRKNSVKVEPTNGRVVVGHFSFTLNDVDLHTRLVVSSSRKRFGFRRRDSRISLNQCRSHATERFYTDREWGHIKKQNIFDITLQHTSLNGGSNGYNLIRVNGSVRLFSEQLSDLLNHRRHSSHTTNENNFVDLAGTDTCILQSGFSRSNRSLYER